MFENLFVEMGPAASVLALLLVVIVPALVVLVATIETGRPVFVAQWQLGQRCIVSQVVALFGRRSR